MANINEENLDQSAYHLLGLDPRKQLKRAQLQRAKAKAEAEINDIFVNAHEREKRKEYIYDVYRHLILRMITRKSKEELALELEFEELYDEEMLKYPQYKPPTPKPMPTEILITNSFDANGFVLLKGAIHEIREKFDQWLIHNKLLNKGFSLAMNTAKGATNILTLTIRGPAEGPHTAKLGVFFRELIRDGYIATRENVLAAGVNPALTPTLKLVPTPGRKKNKDEEDEEEKRSSAPRSPKPFPRPEPK